jgi:hypothetical protein
MIGAEIKFQSFENIHDKFFKIDDVKPCSPIATAEIQSNFSGGSLYILGSKDKVFESVDEFELFIQ